MSKNVVKQPIGKNVVKEPVGKNAVKEPVGKNAVKEPVGKNAVKEPVGKNVVKQPMGKNVVKHIQPVSKSAEKHETVEEKHDTDVEKEKKGLKVIPNVDDDPNDPLVMPTSCQHCKLTFVMGFGFILP